MQPRSILVVKYRNPIVEQRCIRSVVEQTTGPYTLVVVDNGVKNENLSVIWNRWMHRLGGYVCLLNSDCWIEHGDWLAMLCDCIENSDAAKPPVLAVGPTTNAGAGTAQCKHPRANKYVIIDRMLGGFCLVMNTQVALSLGGFDELAPFYGQESDLLRRGRKRGYGTLWRKDVFVWHEGAATAKKFLDVPAEHARGREWYQGKKKQDVV